MSRNFTPKLCMNRVFAINLGGSNEFVFNEEELQAFSIWNNWVINNKIDNVSFLCGGGMITSKGDRLMFTATKGIAAYLVEEISFSFDELYFLGLEYGHQEADDGYQFMGRHMVSVDNVDNEGEVVYDDRNYISPLLTYASKPDSRGVTRYLLKYGVIMRNNVGTCIRIDSVPKAETHTVI